MKTKLFFYFFENLKSFFVLIMITQNTFLFRKNFAFYNLWSTKFSILFMMTSMIIRNFTNVISSLFFHIIFVIYLNNCAIIYVIVFNVKLIKLNDINFINCCSRYYRRLFYFIFLQLISFWFYSKLKMISIMLWLSHTSITNNLFLFWIN